MPSEPTPPSQSPISPGAGVPPILPDPAASGGEKPPILNPPPAAPLFEGRLHPLTLVLVVVSSIRGFLIPAIVVLAVGRGAGMSFMLLFFLVVTLLQALTRYFTFSYRVENGELITRQGVLEKKERNIPLARVQDLRIEQGLTHRLLGVVDVLVETAGGRGIEASLSVLKREQAEALRAAIFAQAKGTVTPGQPEAQSLAKEMEGELIRRVSLKELIWAGLTSNYSASAVVLLAASLQFADDLLPQETYERTVKTLIERVTQWWQQPGQSHTLILLFGGAGIILVGTVISVIGSVVLFHDFTLTRRGEDLCRQYGLLTRRSSSLPRRRIQVLKIEATFLRRLFRLATLRADTAGSRSPEQNQSREGRDVLLPVLPHREVSSLLGVFFPDLDSESVAWQRVSRRAIRRETLKGSMVCVLLAIPTSMWQQSPAGLWPLALMPLAYVIALLNYRHLGYARDGQYFWTRRGWFNRATHLVPIRNAQAIVVRQTPFDRRHGVATLVVDTAGQSYTGGGPQIHNLPAGEAKKMARLLAHRAGALRYRA